MSLSNQYQPLLADVPVLILLSPGQLESERVFEVITQSWQLPFTTLEHPDLHWLNPDDSLKIEIVRELHAQVGYKPYTADVSCYVLSHLETASLPAQQALLKLLEEPPTHVRLILTATSSSNLLPTILSRCQLLTPKPSTNSVVASDAEVTTWYHHVTSLSLGKLVTKAEELGDKDSALAQAQKVLTFLHQQLTTQLDADHRSRTLKQLVHTQDFLEWLSQNVNLKLATTEWLLRLRQA